MTRKHCLTLVLALAVTLGFASQSSAVLVTTTFEAVASGDIDNVDFTDESIVVTSTYDTDNITTFPQGFFVINDSAMIQVGTLTLNVTSITSHAFNNDNSVATFGNDDIEIDGIILESPVFATYDGSTSLGSITGDAFFSGSAFFNTDGGVITFAEAFPVSTSFQAVAVPEPSTFAIWTLAGMAIACSRCTAARKKS